MSVDPLYYILITVLAPFVFVGMIRAGADEHRVDLGLDVNSDNDIANHPTFLIPDAQGASHAQRRRYRIDRTGHVDRRRSTHPSY